MRTDIFLVFGEILEFNEVFLELELERGLESLEKIIRHFVGLVEKSEDQTYFQVEKNIVGGVLILLIGILGEFKWFQDIYLLIF